MGTSKQMKERLLPTASRLLSRVKTRNRHFSQRFNYSSFPVSRHTFGAHNFFRPNLPTQPIQPRWFNVAAEQAESAHTEDDCKVVLRVSAKNKQSSGKIILARCVHRNKKDNHTREVIWPVIKQIRENWPGRKIMVVLCDTLDRLNYFDLSKTVSALNSNSSDQEIFEYAVKYANEHCEFPRKRGEHFRAIYKEMLEDLGLHEGKDFEIVQWDYFLDQSQGEIAQFTNAISEGVFGDRVARLTEKIIKNFYKDICPEFDDLQLWGIGKLAEARSRLYLAEEYGVMAKWIELYGDVILVHESVGKEQKLLIDKGVNVLKKDKGKIIYVSFGTEGKKAKNALLINSKQPVELTNSGKKECEVSTDLEQVKELLRNVQENIDTCNHKISTIVSFWELKKVESLQNRATHEHENTSEISNSIGTPRG